MLRSPYAKRPPPGGFVQTALSEYGQNRTQLQILRSDKRISQARIVYGAETRERKYSTEHLNDLILVEGTESHVARTRFSKIKTTRIDRTEKTFVGAI
jgi:hypothetical protein